MVDRAPTAVSITFTEAPDPALSVVHILNSAGQSVEKGTARPVPGRPERLTVPLGQVPNGVYTVSWRTVSAVDGHVAAGAFAFGIGVNADEVFTTTETSATAGSPSPTSLGVAGRWLYYVGLAIVVGGAWIALAAAGFQPTVLILAVAGGLLALVGLGGLGQDQRTGAGVSWPTFVHTTLGLNLVLQAGPLVIAVALLVASIRNQARRPLLVLALASLAASIGAHSFLSHAAAGAIPWLMVASQFAHISAFTVWIGGLAALLLLLRTASKVDRWRIVKRFSFAAGIGLAVVALSGAIRAVDEVRDPAKLFSSLFGELVLVKVGLLCSLALLGAINRFRNVPRVSESVSGLVRVGGGELGLAAILLVASALLTSLPPPAFVRAASAAPPRIQVEGQDYGTTVRAHLVASPGYAGINSFVLSVADFDSRRPLNARAIKLRFVPVGRADVGESSLELKAGPDLRYRGRGSNLSLEGAWAITAVVQLEMDSVEIRMPVQVKAAPPLQQTGQPTLYTMSLSAGRSVQAYVDPAKAGMNNVHFSVFDSKGAELAIADGVTITASAAGGALISFEVHRQGEGHFIGTGRLDAGTWRFELKGQDANGQPIEAGFRENIKSATGVP